VSERKLAELLISHVCLPLPADDRPRRRRPRSASLPGVFGGGLLRGGGPGRNGCRGPEARTGPERNSVPQITAPAKIVLSRRGADLLAGIERRGGHPTTAKTHVSRAMIKLGARDRAQLVVFAYQAGLVTPRVAR